MDNVWKLGEFSTHVGVHYNTVDRWFKMLEEQQIHYINRVVGEKVYDSLDLEIAKFIEEKRKARWALPGIFHLLPEKFEVRSFPTGFQGGTSNPMIDVERMKTALKEELSEVTTNRVVSEVKEQLQRFQSLLPTPEQSRLERINEFLTHRKIELMLRKQAIEEWEIKPKSERMRKVGLFRKEEDVDARERFIIDYIEEHYEDNVKKSYGLDY